MVVAAVVRLLVALLAWAPGVGSMGATAGTTTGDAATYSYDAPAVARVEVRVLGAARATQAQINYPQEQSAPPADLVRRTSTTPVSPNVATNTVDDLLSSGRQVSGRFPKTANADEVLLRRGADGSVTHYQVYGPDGLPLRRVDVTGASHAGVPTPHVLEFERHVNPTTGQVFVRPADTVRPALPGEIPGAG